MLTYEIVLFAGAYQRLSVIASISNDEACIGVFQSGALLF